MVKTTLACVLMGAALAQDAEAPASPDAERTVDAPEQQVNKIVTPRFTADLPNDWIETPNDWGALAAIKPRGDSIGRAIDVWREAIFVASVEQKAFLDQYTSLLKPTGGGVVDPVRLGRTGNHDVAQIRLRTSAERFQEHWLIFSDDGMYSIVITTTDQYANIDFDAARTLAASLMFTAGADDRDLERFCKGLTPERGWLAETGKRTARLYAPWKATDNQSPLAISITNVGQSMLPGNSLALIDLYKRNAIPANALIETESWATDTPDTWRTDFSVSEDDGVTRRYNLALVFGSKKIFALRMSSSPDRYEEAHRAFLSALAAVAAAK